MKRAKHKRPFAPPSPRRGPAVYAGLGCAKCRKEGLGACVCPIEDKGKPAKPARERAEEMDVVERSHEPVGARLARGFSILSGDF